MSYYKIIILNENNNKKKLSKFGYVNLTQIKFTGTDKLQTDVKIILAFYLPNSKMNR